VVTLPDYEPAFGLRDNPFSPRSFAGVDGGLLNDIAGDPLPLDEAPALEPLFVPGAGPFEAAIEQFDQFLEIGGYRDEDIRGSLASKAFRVIGPEGSGKSTLTNMLVRRLKDCGHEGLTLIRASAEENRLGESIEAVEKKARHELDGVCCVVFDDVRFEREQPLHELHQNLRGPKRRPVVMFEIFHHAQDLGVPPPSGRARPDLEDLRTLWLTAEHAVEFLSSRIQQFRSKGLEFAGDLTTFPFDADEVAGLVGDGDGTEPGAFTLRSLNRMLSRGLGLEWMARRDDEPIIGLSASDLAARRISLKAFYDQRVDEQAGSRV
jgi:hypothetical protein